MNFCLAGLDFGNFVRIIFMDSDFTALNGKQKRFLRGLGNRLEAKVVIGHGGVSESCMANLEAGLTAEELVKVRLQPSSGLDPKEASKMLCEKTGSSEVQVFGKTILLYRKNEETPLLKLP